MASPLFLVVMNVYAAIAMMMAVLSAAYFFHV